MKSAGKLPIHIGWQCTNACNLKCIHCYASAGNISPYELDTQEAKNLIGSISELGSTSIVFTGGEPMMRKDLFDLVGYASDRGLHVIIATNGTMIDERSAELFKELEVAIAINYPAVDENLETYITGLSNSYKLRMRGLFHCLEKKVKTSIGMAITRFNCKEVKRVIEFSAEKDINCDILSTIPTGRATASVLPSVIDYETMLRMLVRDYSALPMHALDSSLQTHVSVYEPFYVRVLMEESGKKFPKLCSLGNAMHVMEDGSVRSCVFMPMTFGNVRIDSLETIWNRIEESSFLQELQDPQNLKGACGRCKYNSTCGGCRARALALTGDPFQEDPMCSECLSL